MPHRNTSGNSRPLAVCSVIICTQSSARVALGFAGFQHRVRQEALQRRQIALGLEAARGADQFIEILDPRLAAIGLVLLVVLEQAAGVDHVIDLLVQRQRRRCACVSCSISCMKPQQRRRRAPAFAGGDRPPPAARHSELPAPRAASRMVSTVLCADAARRQVHDALERGIVVAIGDQAQVRQRVLDLGALEEAQPAVDAVRHARADQRLLEAARLRVGAIQDRGSRAAGRRAGVHSRMRVTTKSASSRSL